MGKPKEFKMPKGKILMGKTPKPVPGGKPKPGKQLPKRGPGKPRTPAERKFIEEQLRENPRRAVPKGGMVNPKRKNLTSSTLKAKQASSKAVPTRQPKPKSKMSGYNYGTKQGPGFTGGSKPVYTRPNEGGTVSQYRPQLEKGSLGRYGYDNFLTDNNAYGTEMKNGSGSGIIGKGDPIWKRDIIEKRNVDYVTQRRTGGGKGGRKTSKGGK